jgi:BioD-like phosphotransacetylase family protein
VIESSDSVGAGIAFEFQANFSIAKNLSAPAINVPVKILVVPTNEEL